MATYPLDTLAPTITPTGVSAPTYTDVLESLKASFRSIYGSDAYIDADSQDGQWIAIIAKAISDNNDGIKAAYSAFQPSGAIGAGLSANVKINGIRRLPATNSQATLVVNGTPGTPLGTLQVRDTLNQVWQLPTVYNIPAGGSGTVTATCTVSGPILAAPNTIRIPVTPVAGWASVTNPADATAGAPAESDAALRTRQAASVAAPSETRLEAILAAVENVVGVRQARIYENTANATDANGLPAHSIAVVVSGGSTTDLAAAIMNSKTPGAFLFGSTSTTIVDAVGITQTIRWTVPSIIDIKVALDITALTGYTTDVGTKVENALIAFVNALPTGDPVYWSRLWQPANLVTEVVNDVGDTITIVDADNKTYKINSLLISVGAGSPSTSDIAIAFSQEPRLLIGNITLTVH